MANDNDLVSKDSEEFVGLEYDDFVITHVDELGTVYLTLVDADKWLAFCKETASNLVEMGWTAEERSIWKEEYQIHGCTADKIEEIMASLTSRH